MAPGAPDSGHRSDEFGPSAAWTPAPIPGMPRGLRCDRATMLHPHKPLGGPAYLDLLLCVLELRQGLDGFLGRAREYVLPVLLLQLVDRNRDIVSSETDEPPCPDDD